MLIRNTADRYGAIAQAFHWAIVVLIIVQFTLGIIGSDLPVGMQRLIVLSRHKSFGMTIFMLVLLRLAWRLANPVPRLPDKMPRLHQRLAHATHWLLYALLLTMPVVGWISSSASNLTVSWFGIFTWPDLVGTNKELATAAKELHEVLAWILFTTVTLHLAAALRHHFVLKDDILLRMLPQTQRRERP